MTPAKNHYAVIMGDIVASRGHDKIADLHKRFNTAIDRFNADYRSVIVSPMTITLGDEFQGLVPDLATAFDIAHGMRLHLLADRVSCRFVIGSVRLDTPVNPQRAWNMMGEGLSQARAALNDKKADNCYRFSLPANAVAQALLDSAGLTMTTIESGWTETQRHYAIAALTRGNRTNRELVKSLETSERNYYKVLEAGNLKLYRSQRDSVRRALELLSG